VEPFAGAASVLLQKPISRVEVLNDKYSRLVSVFRVLRNQGQSAQLAELLALTPYSEEEYQACREQSPDAIEDARRMIVLGHQSHGSTGASGGKLSGWRRGVRTCGGSSADEWRHLWAHVERWATRLRGVYLENDDAVAVMQRWDAKETLHYVDPPYVASSRVAGMRGYAHEMDDDAHRALADALGKLDGMVIISGYASPLYDEIFAGWERLQRSHVADRGNRRTEVVWMRNVPGNLFGLNNQGGGARPAKEKA